MNSKINKIVLATALIAMGGMTSCVGDLDQMPQDPAILSPSDFAKDPKAYMGGVMAKCYSSIAVSGQSGSGSSDISGLDNGRSCWSRAIFMLNEFTTDEVNWIWKDSGIFDLCTNTWGSNNENIFGTYSRLYTHIAVCNDFIRLLRNHEDYDIKFDAEMQGIAAQFELEARALRGLSYFYVLDLFGNAAYCWDTQVTGEEGPQMSRAELFNLVTADLEQVLAAFPDTKPVYGRIGKDAVEALLAKYYLNAEVFTGTAQWQKCWDHCQAVINRHKSGGFEYNGTPTGLVQDYLSLFCANNDLFMPGGANDAQNEILWGIPYSYRQTESYGGSSFLILAAISDQNISAPSWYGMNGQWTCMHARPEFSEKFDFSSGVSTDGRTFLWLTESDGFNIANTDFSTYKDGYVPIKFTNVKCNPDGTMPRWQDPTTGLNRAGVHDLDNRNNYGIDATEDFADTDLPVIRLAEIYLTAAEANLRGGVGSRAQALEYVNAVRARAYNYEGAVQPAAWNEANLTLDNLLDERARELYWENCRRTDLVRFGKFTGASYLWSWKNNVATGATIPAHMNVFPIPTSVINSYSSTYVQNPGY